MLGGGSYQNLAALADDTYGADSLVGGGPLSFSAARGRASRNSIDDQDTRKQSSRFIFVSNHLPVRCARGETGWEFEWDEDALIAQAKEGVGEDLEVMFVGCLPVEIDFAEQEMVALELYANFNCFPVFLGAELKERYYKGFCKQQLWPLFHYLLPLSPGSNGRFNPDLWQAYVKANKAFADKLVEVISMDDDYVWIHDYHLLVLPSLLRKRFHRMRCGLFLHSPFPSSEIFRTFPKREELLRSLLNADLIGFHTFDYARHFLSCCARMLGIEHVTRRGSIVMEYFGRDVSVKIMPTGVKPERFLGGFDWGDTQWRRGELVSQFEGQTVLIGVDDMDVFKGIELKLQAVERVLDHHPEWRGRLTLVQVTNAPRSSSRDISELHAYILDLVKHINSKYASDRYQPIVWLERPVPLYEKIALYSIADVAVVTATRDGMNLVPYEYIVCRQGAPDVEQSQKHSMLVVSEFVGCSPSVSGAIRVNPWSVDSVADGIYSAIKMPQADRHMRHEKHWRYVSSHTAAFWARSFVSDLSRLTQGHSTMKCYGLGLGLDTFRMVALTEHFRRLDAISLMSAYQRGNKRLFLLDYDGTLMPSGSINACPTEEVLHVLRGLCADPNNVVFIISGRARQELSEWFGSIAQLGLAAEHGYYMRLHAGEEWEVHSSHGEFAWKEMVLPILQVYTESTDGSYIESKESAVTWHYKDADPDFGRWQSKLAVQAGLKVLGNMDWGGGHLAKAGEVPARFQELLDHLEGMLSNEAVEVSGGQSIVEVKPQNVSKGNAVDRILERLIKTNHTPDFVLVVGDDRSDEDMFTAIEHVHFSPHVPAEVFACTVGQKPSKAPFYMNDTAEVAGLLSRLAEQHPAPQAAPAPPTSSSSVHSLQQR